MSKLTKIIITIIVFSVVIFGFIMFMKPKEKSAEEFCKEMNSTLISKAKEYFANNLPNEVGDTKYISVVELLAKEGVGDLDLTDPKLEIKGNVYVSKGKNNEYFYSTDFLYGTCSSNDTYTSWSDYVYSVPNVLKENSQVQTTLFYNYGKKIQKYTDWSNWGLILEELKEPELPEGVAESNTEKEEKIQYSYRDGLFKWYKLSGDYYNDGAYYETAPDESYHKDLANKVVSRTTEIKTSKTALTSSLEGLTYDLVTTNAYKTDVKKYIYSKTISVTQCPLYKCYTLSSIGSTYVCEPMSGEYYKTVECYTKSAATALADCMYGASMKCYEQYGVSFCREAGAIIYTRCERRTCGSGSNITYGYIYKHSLSWPPSSNCPATHNYITAQVYKKNYYNNSELYDTCPSGYAQEASGSYSTNCSSTSDETIISQTVYLKADGTQTDSKDSAAYLSDSEFSNLGTDGIGYTKTSYSKTETGDYVEGTCPGGVSSSTCTQVVAYKAKIYKFKWYLSSTSLKTWYNDGEYTTKSPESGYQPDITSANWGEWSEFSDTKVSSSTTRQVKTQVMKRIRKSYYDAENLTFEEYLPLEEFEKETGKATSELLSDSSLIVKKKLVYKFRTLK